MVPSNDWMGRYAHRSTQGALAVAAITRLLLERSEKFGLQFQRKVADFVKDRVPRSAA